MNDDEASVGFDYDEVDRECDGALTNEDEAQIRCEAVSRLIGSIIRNGPPSTLPSRIRQAFTGFVAIAWAVRPDAFNNASMRTLCKDLGLSHSALSKRLLQFSDEYGLHFRGQKRTRTREMYSRLQKNNHWRNK